MMSYGGVRLGMGTIGSAADDAAVAAAAAAAGAIVALPPGVRLARVTTHDPAPLGDLSIRVAPDDSAAKVPGGGAEKDGIVAVVNENVSPTYAEVIWPGGDRRPAAQGFAHKAFLAFLPAGDPAAPPLPPGVSPSSPEGGGGMSLGAKVGIGLGVAAALGLAWWALK